MSHRTISKFSSPASKTVRFIFILLLLGVAGECAPALRAQNLSVTPGLLDLYNGDPSGGTAANGSNYTGPLSGLQLGGIGDIESDSEGNFYVSDPGANANSGGIRFISRTTAATNPLLPGVALQKNYVYPMIGAKGNFPNDGSIPCTDAGANQFGDGCPAKLAYAITPMGMAIDANGNLYFADNFISIGLEGELRVLYVKGTVPGLVNPKPGYVYALLNAGGAQTTGGSGVPALQSGITPGYVAVDGQGNIYFSPTAFGGTDVYVIYAQGNVPNLPASPAPAAGHVYDIITVNGVGIPFGGAAGAAAGGILSLLNPAGLKVDASGNLYIADNGPGSGVYAVYAGSGSLPGVTNPQVGTAYDITNIIQPQFLAFDAASNLYVSGSSSNVSIRIDPAGTITTVVSPPPLDPNLNNGNGGYPTCALAINPATNPIGDGCNAFNLVPQGQSNGLAVDPEGNLYFSVGVTLQKVDVSTSSLLFTGTAGFPAADVTALLTNTGVAPLNFTGLTVSNLFQQVPSKGTLNGAVDCSPSTTLASGASCALAFGYTVASAGTQTGTVTITSDALNAISNQNTIALTGILGKASTLVTVSATPAYPIAATAGQPVTLTATLTPHYGSSVSPTGTVSFATASGTALGNGTISGNTATLEVSSLPAGVTSIVASYAGDTNFLASASGPYPVSISSKRLPSITLASTSSAPVLGSSVTLTATVAPSAGGAAPTGKVTFFDGKNPLSGQIGIDGSGVASFPTSALPIGISQIYASYSGDANYGATYSAPLAIAVSGTAQLAFAPAVIDKIAGQYGNAGYSGDGGPANVAQINATGIVTDSAGNIYLSGNGVIRVIPSQNRMTIANVSVPVANDIYTIAGNGNPPSGSIGDGGPATNAIFNGLSAIAVDSFGNIYVIDYSASYQRIIRRIDGLTGIINTIAGGGTSYGEGGLAINAGLVNPRAMAIDNQGNVYFADNSIRRIDAQTGLITTIAGALPDALGNKTFCPNTPAACGDGGPAYAALLNVPTDVAIDAAGNIYVADAYDDAIRRIDAKTAIITTVAGNYTPGANGDTGDGGPALSAQLNGPSNTYPSNVFSLKVDAAGDLYILDGGPLSVDSNSGQATNYPAVRMVSAATGIITTIVGGSTACGAGVECGDKGLATNAAFGGTAPSLALDSQANLYILSDVVRAIPVGTSAITFATPTTPNLGTVNTQAFALSNTGGSPLNISSLTVNTTSTPVPNPPDFFEAASNSGAGCSTVTSLAPGANCSLTLEWFPTVIPAAKETATVAVMSNSLNASNGANTISLQGTGVGSQGSTAQTITFPALNSTYTYGSQITLGASTDALDSGTGKPLAISYRVSGPATLSGTTLTASGVGTVNVTAYQFGNTNYKSAASQSQSFTVTPATLTVTSTTSAGPSILVGTPIPALTYTIPNTDFKNGDTQASVVTGTPTEAVVNPATGATVAVGSTPPIGTYNITIAQNTLSAGVNYTLNFVSDTLKVTGSGSQKIQFGSLANVTYGVSPILLTAASVDAQTGAPTGLTVSYTVTTTNGTNTLPGDLLTITGAGGTGAGAVTVTAQQAGGLDYHAAASVSQSFTVAQASLTVTAGNVSIAQNAPLPDLAMDYNFSGFLRGDTSSSVTGVPSISTTAANTATIGPYPIAISQGSLSSTNYSFTFVPGTLSVVAGQSQRISFPAIAGVTYGASPLALAARSSSGLGVSYTVTSGPATVAGNTLTITGSGIVTVAASQSGNSAYTPAAPVSQTFTVNPATLTVTAQNASRVNDVPNPPFSAVITGFVNGDTAATAVNGTPTFTTSALPGSPVGTYPITFITDKTVVPLLAANYTFVYVPGTLTITSGGPMADYSITASPSALTIIAGGIQQTSLTLTPTNYYQGTIQLSCSNLPADVSCVFSPGTFTPDGTGSTQIVTLTVNTNPSAPVVGQLPQSDTTGSNLALALFLPGGLAAFVWRKRKPAKKYASRMATLMLLLGGFALMTACGGGSGNSAGKSPFAAPGTAVVTIMAAGSNSVMHSVDLTLNIK